MASGYAIVVFSPSALSVTECFSATGDACASVGGVIVGRPPRLFCSVGAARHRVATCTIPDPSQFSPIQLAGIGDAFQSGFILVAIFVVIGIVVGSVLSIIKR